MGSGYPPPTLSRQKPLGPDLGGSSLSRVRHAPPAGSPCEPTCIGASGGQPGQLLAESAERTGRQASSLSTTGAIPEALDTCRCRGLRLSGARIHA